VQIYSRRGCDFTGRFPRVLQAVKSLKVGSVLLDGEGIFYGVAWRFDPRSSRIL
jgi:ATP-dependent DNA ligase